MRSPAALLLTGLAALAGPPATLRVDYLHTAGLRESFRVERTVLEPLPWPGPPEPADPGPGECRVEVRDPDGRLRFSQGFSTLSGEWAATAAARTEVRTFQESFRLPRPESPVRVALLRRGGDGSFREVWGFRLDPRRPLHRSRRPGNLGPLTVLQERGPSPAKVDLLVLGDGYTAAERGAFLARARDLVEALFTRSPFKEHRDAFNVRALCPASPASGIDRPSAGLRRRSALGFAYDTFGSERYVLAASDRPWRAAAAWAPYDAVVVLVNGGAYGGGGICGLYATTAAGSARAPYLFVHEFAHHFAGLADEYYTSEVAYETGPARPEPWEPNITADPLHPKWADLATPGVPLPTPWSKAAYEAQTRAAETERRRLRAERRPEAEMEAHMAAQEAADAGLLGAEPHAGWVGAFEGANYAATGWFRPSVDCVMFSRNPVPFCPVCRRALEAAIRRLAP